MKKLLSALMAFALLLSCAACSNNAASEGSAPTPPQSSTIGFTNAEESNAQKDFLDSNNGKEANTQDDSSTTAKTGSKSLIVYFSWSGNTENVAKAIQSQTDADIFEIVPQTPYSDDYDTVLDLVQEEKRDSARPAISGSIENIEHYDVIYVGFPIWWGDMPMILYTFFDTYDLSNKTVALFCTSGGSGLSGTVDEVKSLEPEATVTEGLHIGSSSASDPDEAVSEWLGNIELAKSEQPPASNSLTVTERQVPENFVLIKGGSFPMGSPESEAWRSDDETQHLVTVSDFYLSRYELMQKEYEEITGNNPSNFAGENLPVENISWLDAVAYCNARSEKEGLTPVYTIDGQNVSWDRSANGYRLPTEAEWEYACRAGTATPFYMANSPSAEDANYYGHYPYEIEDNYFSQSNLTVKPGEYRQTTVPVDSFSTNPYGLYNMHGNVSEWVWDYYGDYSTDEQIDPAGPASGTLRVYRGGGWNDFAKNMRSAYRATLEQNKGSFNLGIRLVLNAAPGSDSISSTVAQSTSADGDGKILIAYFSWGGNTKGIAEEIQSQTEADLFEITMVNPYSSDYNTVLDEAQRDQNEQARPELANSVDNMDEYDIVMIGYPNWWASIPMPVASFLEGYDFTGKTILPFCSHGGGRFGQSLTAITKLAPDATMGEALSVHYSGGSELAEDVTDWLTSNGII